MLMSSLGPGNDTSSSSGLVMACAQPMARLAHGDAGAHHGQADTLMTVHVGEVHVDEAER
ncbi:MAG: hypothetical protein ACLSAH_20290 [Bilophila wadsworthia]